MVDSLNANIDALLNELSITKSQLASKCQAICILKQQLDDSKKEANQFKLLLEQLQERYRNLRKTLDSDLDGQCSASCAQKKLILSLKIKLSESAMQNRILEAEIDNLRKRNSELAEDALLRSTGTKCESDEFMKSSSMTERKSLISRLELKTIQCQRLRRELELCNDEKQELLFELKNNTGKECGSAKCKALFQENRLLSRQIARLEADKKMLTNNMAKYRESSLSSSNVASSALFEGELRDRPIDALGGSSDSKSAETQNENPSGSGEE